MDTKDNAQNPRRRRPAGSRGAGESGAAQRTTRPRSSGTARGTGRRAPTEGKQTGAKRTQQRPTARRTAPAGKQRAAAGSRPRRPVPKKRVARPMPDVVYTPPKPVSRNQILLSLASVVAVVLALTFGMSIFFKVEGVRVSGMDKYSAWTVAEASGIENGDNLLTLSKAQIVGRIKAALPYVNTVRIGRQLPDTVHIEITEFDVFYSVKSQDGKWWAVTAGGRVLEQINAAAAGECTQILGVTLAEPVAGQQAVAYEAPPEVDETGETVMTAVQGKDRLSAALSIAEFLEQNEVVGQVTSMDVTDLAAIELWYGQRYQVQFGDTTQLGYKVICMKKAIATLPAYESGILDVSFTLVKDKPMFTPFP